MKNTLDNYDADYPYKKDTLTTDISSFKYPVMERTNNGLLFPLGPNNKVDMNDMKEE